MKAYKFSKKTKKRSWRKIAPIIAVIILVLIGATLFMYRHMYTDNLRAVTPGQHKEVVVAIPSGSSVNEIAKILKTHNVIRTERAFKQYIRSQELASKLKAGTYRLYSDQTVAEIANDLVEGKVAVDLFTILPGQRLDQIRAAFIAEGFNANDVDKALDPNNYAGNAALVDKPKGASLEGYLYPDSFQKTAETSPSTIVEQSLAEMASYLTADLRAVYAAKNLTTYQAIILASIVEREVSNGEDRPKVAQVFIKRLSIGMMLGSDVTACYGAITAGVMQTGDNCNNFVGYDSAYNTRIHTGMPPGPISNVSKSGLLSVANPTTTDYLYFVAGDDGMTYFSKTYDEHQAAVAQHCKLLCQ